MLIEQAIFSSAQTDRSQGYQLLGRSSGLSESDARELSVWGPSHDSLLPRPGEPSSTNFFRLSSGAYSVSLTSTAGNEYSGRGGRLVYTQFLVVAPEQMARFANNPFAVLRAAQASGALQVYDPIPAELPQLRLSGRAQMVDQMLLAQLARTPGAAAMTTFVQAALASERLAVTSEAPAEELIAGLFNLLPVECRGEISFSTGLKNSPSRPVRITWLAGDPSSWRGVARQGFTLLKLDSTTAANETEWQGWPGYIASVLSSGKISALTTQLEVARPWLSLDSLDKLAEEASKALRSVATRPRNLPPAKTKSPPETISPPLETTPLELVRSAEETPLRRQQRADAPHVNPTTVTVGQGRSALEELAESLAAQPPEILELLEHIDDLVFAAISGDADALAELEVLWGMASMELDSRLVEQAREQYLRCALSIWSECMDDDLQRPEKAVAAIDVLRVLFEE